MSSAWSLVSVQLMLSCLVLIHRPCSVVLSFKRDTRSRRYLVKPILSDPEKSTLHFGLCWAYPTRPDLNGSLSPKRRRDLWRWATAVVSSSGFQLSSVRGARRRTWQNTAQRSKSTLFAPPSSAIVAATSSFSDRLRARCGRLHVVCGRRGTGLVWFAGPSAHSGCGQPWQAQRCLTDRLAYAECRPASPTDRAAVTRGVERTTSGPTTSYSSRPLQVNSTTSKISFSSSLARTGGSWCGCAMLVSTPPSSGVSELVWKQSDKLPFKPANANKRLRLGARRHMPKGVKKLELRGRPQTTWRKRRALRPPQ